MTGSAMSGWLGDDHLRTAMDRLAQVAAGDEVEAVYADFTFPGHTFRADLRAYMTRPGLDVRVREVVSWLADEIAAAERGKQTTRRARKIHAKAEAVNRLMTVLR